MNRLFRFENFVIAGYLIVLGAALVAIFGLNLKQQAAMPVFIGIFSIGPFVIYFRAANRIAPRSSRLFLMLNALLIALFFIPWLNFSFCLPLPLLIVFMFLVSRERRAGFEHWLEQNKFSPVANPPAEILETLGRDRNWRCWANSFFLAGGREVPYLLWCGMLKTNVTTYSNGVPIQTVGFIPQLGFSFFPQTVNEKFRLSIESKSADRQSFWKKLTPSSDELYPYQTARLPDETFIAAWSIGQIPAVLDEKLAEIKTLLEQSTT